MYIRTDFHIYKIKSEEIIQGEKYYNIEIQGGLNKLKAEFGKQAETIEELCDEFVIVRNGERPTILINYDNLSLLKARVVKDNQKVYGAIWTDKGLIYVAKMNENGVLELL